MERTTSQRLGRRLLATCVIVSLVITLFPTYLFAIEAPSKTATEHASSEEDLSTRDITNVTQDDVIQKTEDTTTYDLGAGEKMTVFHGGQVRYEDEQGELVDYDRSLEKISKGDVTPSGEPLAGYSYTNKEGDKKQYLPKSISEQTPILMESEDHQITLTPSKGTMKDTGLQGATVSVKKKETPTLYETEETLPVVAEYQSKEASASFSYESGEFGIKETLTLNEKPASNVFTYVLTLKGMIPKSNPTDNGITFFDEESGDIVADVSPAWMNDASGEAYSDAITYEIQETEGNEAPSGGNTHTYLLTMTIDATYLEDENRQYPVTVDPTVTWKGKSEVTDVYVISGSYAKTNFYSSGTKVMPAGKNSTGTHQTYVLFENLKKTIKGQSISSAKFTVYEVGDGEKNQTISLYRVTKKWNASTLTWNNKPSNTSTVHDTIKTKNKKYTAQTFNIKSFVNSLSKDSYANYGMVLKNTTSNKDYAAFYGSRYGTAAYRPKLVVTYYSKPTTATSASLSPRYVKDSKEAKLTFSGISSSGLDHVEYKVVAYDDSTASEGDVKLNYSASRPIKSGGTLPELSEGCYKVYARGVNKAGTAGSGKSAGILHVDKQTPSVETVKLLDKDGKELEKDYTGESNPKIAFSGITDSHVDKSSITYVLAQEDLVPTGSQFKAPETLNINSSSPYEGSFELTGKEQETETGAYRIHVRVKDKAGNSVTKILHYRKDVTDPTGEITVTEQATGDVTEVLTGTANIQCDVDGTGSPVKESSLKLYRMENGKVFEESATTLYDNEPESRTVDLNTVRVCRKNGTYRLVLTVKDGVGRQATITKDVEVLNTFAAPEIQVLATGQESTRLTWSFATGLDVQKLAYQWEGQTGWSYVEAEDGEEFPLGSSRTIDLPRAEDLSEGRYKLQVRGIGKDGVEGDIAVAACTVDYTMPVVEISQSKLVKGYLMGTIRDENFAKWELYVKGEEETGYSKVPYASGTKEVKDERITFVDLGAEPFEPGKSYVLKLIARDTAGNSDSRELEITVPEDGNLETRVAPTLHVDYGDGRKTEEGYLLGTDGNALKLRENAEEVTWYIDNEKKENGNLHDETGAICYAEGDWHDVLVVQENPEGEKRHNVSLTRNVKEEVTFDEKGNSQRESESSNGDDSSQRTSGDTSSTVSKTATITLEDPAVSVRLEQEAEDVTYRILAEDGRYVTLQEGVTCDVSDLLPGRAYTTDLMLSVESDSEHSLPEFAVLRFDTIEKESFQLLTVENYAPKNLSVADKINYKTYLTWDIPKALPANISYEIYRGTKQGFTPEKETLAKEYVQAGYFAEINTKHSQDFYYRVCAVLTDEDGTVLQRSSFSSEQVSRAVDEAEYDKSLGLKEYWEYAEFETPGGEGYVEKSRGNLVYQQKDGEIANEGLEVFLTRTYNSQSSSKGSFGYGWSHDYDIELLNVCRGDSLAFQNVVLKDGDGTIYHFTRKNVNDEFVSSLGSYIHLQALTEEKEKTVRIPGRNPELIRYQFILKTKDQLQYYFSSGGELLYLEEPNGNFLLFEHEPEKGRLVAMRTCNNLVIEFSYGTEKEGQDPLLVQEVTLPDGSSRAYEYTNSHENSKLPLLSAVTEYGAGDTKKENGITWKYGYEDVPVIGGSLNLRWVNDAKDCVKYLISYDYTKDAVTEVRYPDDEKISFAYAKDHRSTVTTKYADGEVIFSEKDWFDETFRNVKTKRGFSEENEGEAAESGSSEVTEYTYRGGLLASTKTTEEYSLINEEGYIERHQTSKENRVEYAGDLPVKETEEDGTVSQYTYYTKADGEHLEDLVKTVRETDGNGTLVTDEVFEYDEAGNVTLDIDYAAGTKTVQTYVNEGEFQGELSTEEEYLIESSGHSITKETLQERNTYSYAYRTEEGQKVKEEETIQEVPKGDETTETVIVSTLYDAMGRELSETDTRGYQTKTTYDGFGRAIKIEYGYGDGVKETSSKEYDENGRVLYEKVEDGTEKWYTYDKMNRVTSTRVKRGDVDETLYSSYCYEDITLYLGKGSGTRKVENAYVTKESYDAPGELPKLSENIISESYEDSKGNTVRIFEKGLYTDMTYDFQGNMVGKWSMGKNLSSEEGILELYVYDSEGNLTETVTEPEYVSEGKGNASTGYKVTGDSIVSHAEYDNAGNVIKSTDPFGNSETFTYDAYGKILSVTHEDGTTYEYRYDEEGAGNTTKDVVYTPASGTSGEKSISEVTYDSTDRVLRVEDFGTGDGSDSIFTDYAYDARDNLTRAVDAEGNYRTYRYDVKDRLLEVAYYEKDGEKSERTQKTTFTYDKADNLLSMADYAVSGGEERLYRYTAYEYDGVSRLTGVSEVSVTEDMQTKLQDGIPEASVLAKNKICYGYDRKDNLISITYPKGMSKVSGLEFTYDRFDNLQKVTAIQEDGSEAVLREYEYNGFGQVREMKDHTDALHDSRKVLTRTYQYDKLQRPIAIEYRDNMSGSSSEVKEAHYYKYDKGNNIVRDISLNHYGKDNGAVQKVEKEYTYDGRGRLIQTERCASTLNGSTGSENIGIEAETEKESTESEGEEGEEEPPNEEIRREAKTNYEYDAAGNRIRETVKEDGELQKKSTYTYNGFQQLTASVETDETGSAISEKSYLYDRNGNQIKAVDTATEEERIYEYDGDNRLVHAVGKTEGILDFDQTNRYNGFGQRIQKAEGKSAGDITHYFYDGTAVFRTEDGEGKETSFNLIGAEDNILSTIREDENGEESFYTYTKDLRESSINLLGTDGKAVVSYEYDDYGETTALGSEDFYNEVCYGGGIYDQTTGLYYLNARYYNPEDAVFLTQDTYRGSRSRTETLNLYAYCTGNPVNYTDPTGHWVWAALGAGIGAYDGHKYAKKKGYRGLKRAACIIGGAALGAVNPCKVLKVAKVGRKAVKACRYAKKGRSTFKKAKATRKAVKKPKMTKATKKKAKKAVKPAKAKFAKKQVGKAKKKITKAKCFAAGTKIHTKNGFQAIETIRPGDYVWSENPETNSKALKKVKKIFVREKDSILRLSINGEVIETTEEHPFYVEGKGFIEASRLQIGESVRLEDGRVAQVESKELVHLQTPVKVYNFEVEDYHTYYVSTQKVLVRNTCASGKNSATKRTKESHRLKENYAGKVKAGNGAPPENFSPEGAGRNGAFREAKRASGIPVSSQPKEVLKAHNRAGNSIEGREYIFEGPKGSDKDKKILEHYGHTYPDNPTQNRGRHFNDIYNNHYDYD